MDILRNGVFCLITLEVTIKLPFYGTEVRYSSTMQGMNLQCNFRLILSGSAGPADFFCCSHVRSSLTYLWAVLDSLMCGGDSYVDLSPEVTGNMFDPGGVMGASMELVDVRLDPGGVTAPPPTW